MDNVQNFLIIIIIYFFFLRQRSVCKVNYLRGIWLSMHFTCWKQNRREIVPRRSREWRKLSAKNLLATVKKWVLSYACYFVSFFLGAFKKWRVAYISQVVSFVHLSPDLDVNALKWNLKVCNESTFCCLHIKSIGVEFGGKKMTTVFMSWLSFKNFIYKNKTSHMLARWPFWKQSSCLAASRHNIRTEGTKTKNKMSFTRKKLFFFKLFLLAVENELISQLHQLIKSLPWV